MTASWQPPVPVAVPKFWAKGIFQSLPPDGSSPAQHLHGQIQLPAYIGGSGGQCSDQRLQKFGWAAVAMVVTGSAWNVVGCLTRALPGEQQTTNRAEMWPLVALSQRAQGPCLVHTDSQYLRAGWHASGHSTRLDLWSALHHAIADFHLSKAKAHCSLSKVTLEGVLLWIGNASVDVGAGLAAAWCATPPSVIQQTLALDHQATEVLDVLLDSSLQWLQARGEPQPGQGQPGPATERWSYRLPAT